MQEHETRERERAAHDGERSEPIAESSGERRGDHSAESVGADGEAGDRRG